MVTLITFAFWENEGNVGVTGLEGADVSTDGVTGLDTGGESSNNCAISDDFSEGDFDSFFDVILDLEIDEWDDGLIF